MRGLRIIVPLLLGVAAACGPTASATASSAGAAVKATLTDNKIALDQASAAGGNVTVTAVNSGTVVHSLVLLKTDLAQDKIPVDTKDAARVQETGLVKGTGQIPAGQTKAFTAKLDPGAYVLLCNEPAHYAIGMHIGFTVK